MKETIIKISEPFTYNYSLTGGYDDEDDSTLCSSEVFEAIILKNNTVDSICRLMGNNAINHIQSPIIIAETKYESGYNIGAKITKYREANIEEIQEAIAILKTKSYQFNGGSAKYVDKMDNYLTQIKRETTLNKIV